MLRRNTSAKQSRNRSLSGSDPDVPQVRSLERNISHYDEFRNLMESHIDFPNVKNCIIYDLVAEDFLDETVDDTHKRNHHATPASTVDPDIREMGGATQSVFGLMLKERAGREECKVVLKLRIDSGEAFANSFGLALGASIVPARAVPTRSLLGIAVRKSVEVHLSREGENYEDEKRTFLHLMGWVDELNLPAWQETFQKAIPKDALRELATWSAFVSLIGNCVDNVPIPAAGIRGDFWVTNENFFIREDWVAGFDVRVTRDDQDFAAIWSKFLLRDKEDEVYERFCTQWKKLLNGHDGDDWEPIVTEGMEKGMTLYLQNAKSAIETAKQNLEAVLPNGGVDEDIESIADWLRKRVDGLVKLERTTS